MQHSTPAESHCPTVARLCGMRHVIAASTRRTAAPIMQVQCTQSRAEQSSHSAVQCSAVQCSAVQCSAVQCSAVQCSAVQSNAVQSQCSAAQSRAEQSRTSRGLDMHRTLALPCLECKPKVLCGDHLQPSHLCAPQRNSNPCTLCSLQRTIAVLLLGGAARCYASHRGQHSVSTLAHHKTDCGRKQCSRAPPHDR
jgi:hypothetical protein